MFICQDRLFVQQFAQKRQSLTCDVSVQQNLLPFSLNHYSLEIGPSDQNYIESPLPPQKHMFVSSTHSQNKNRPKSQNMSPNFGYVVQKC